MSTAVILVASVATITTNMARSLHTLGWISNACR